MKDEDATAVWATDDAIERSIDNREPVYMDERDIDLGMLKREAEDSVEMKDHNIIEYHGVRRGKLWYVQVRLVKK